MLQALSNVEILLHFIRTNYMYLKRTRTLKGQNVHSKFILAALVHLSSEPAGCGSRPPNIFGGNILKVLNQFDFFASLISN